MFARFRKARHKNSAALVPPLQPGRRYRLTVLDSTEGGPATIAVDARVELIIAHPDGTTEILVTRAADKKSMTIRQADVQAAEPVSPVPAS